MEVNEMHPVEVAKAFVDRINAHDVNGLADLMTEDHVAGVCR
jgi:ketosteroid isomerase-like protein